MGIIPWSPLKNGFLTGKYTRQQQGLEGEGRLQALTDVPTYADHPKQHWAALRVLLGVAEAIGRSPAQVALNWVTQRPGVVSTLIGARNLSQLQDNLAALEFDLPAEHVQRLDEVSQLQLGHPTGCSINRSCASSAASTSAAWPGRLQMKPQRRNLKGGVDP